MSTELQHQPMNVERTPGEPTSLREAWGEFRDSVGVKPPSKSPEPKEEPKRTEAKDDLTAEQRENWNKTGEIPKQEQKAEAKVEAKPEENRQLAGDPKKETPQTAYDRMLERASKEPDFEKVVERLHEPFFPLSQEGTARYQVMAQALGQVSNGDDIVYFLARPENASIVRNMQDATPQKIAQVIHSISADLRFGARTKATPAAEPPKPRAPKAPPEVGGRNASPGDALVQAAKEGNFAAFEAEANARAARSRR